MGIDPGLSGAIALLHDDGRLEVFDMPVGELKVGGKTKRRIIPELLADIIAPCNGSVCALEKVSAMPGQGVSSVFNFGSSWGMARGMLAVAQIEVIDAHPATWKKHFRLGSGKDASRHKVCSMFPKQAGLFARVKDDGRAEAVLLAVYARDIS
jgi:crossover junction endodeoxyribonuclease RuvC